MTRGPWDLTTDVVVVGFGGAGACTAITAADQGARVVILEKQPAEWHTPSTKASGGLVTAVDDVEKALLYFDQCAGGMIPLEVSRAWVERAADVVDWLERVVGIQMTRCTGAEHPSWDGAESVSAYGAAAAHAPGDRYDEVVATLTARERAKLPTRPLGWLIGGRILFEAIEAATKRHDGIEVLYEHAAFRLVRGESGRVVGVEAKVSGGVHRIEARKAVVLTCGGYEYDEALKLGYLRASPMYFYGSPMNTGDGVRMAQAVGADLWHMNSMIGRAIGHVEPDGVPYNFAVMLRPGGYVFLDKYGKRFVNEHMQAASRHDFYYELINYDAQRSEYPRIPAYWFFDERRMRAGPLDSASGAAGPFRYEWSAGSEKELALGWLHRAEDFEELAARAGIADPARAAQSLREYNEGCSARVDPFGRPADSLTPLDRPPYYCMPLWPGGPNTSGGPRRNERAEVVDVFGDPIPGLYSAGELGEAVGALYPADGGNLSDALCFGRIAGEQAASQP